MARSIGLAAAAALLLTPPGPAQARPDPVDSRDPGMVEVTVTLRGQASLPLGGTSSRAERKRRVEQALQSHAASSQRGLIAMLRARQASGSVQLVEPLWVSNAVIVRARPSVLREISRRPDVLEVRPATTLEAPLATSTGAIGPEANLGVVGAPQLWAQGHRGEGVVVASLDTGVDASHPDLAARWRGGSNSWYDPNGQHPTTPVDVNGHGTQVMGVMVGDGTNGLQVGMAPGARWIAAKIFNDRGQATTTGIHLALQWLLDPDRNAATADAPDVVNNSWTMSSTACDTQFQADLRSLRAAGLLPVFAAGNIGPQPGTIQSPANYPESFAVGATDNADALYPYGSRGPSACPAAVAPALTAPGTSITTTDLYGGYAAETGTSVAAPHVSGALALLLSAHPGLDAQRQADALVAGAHDLGPTGLDPDFGYGRLDVPAADAWLATTPDFTVAVTPGSVTAPRGSSAAYDIAVSGANGFGGDVSLGVPSLPAGVSATVDPALVPGGTGTAHLTLAVTGSAAPGTYPFTVVGTSGSMSRSSTATLVVPVPPDFSLGLSPASATVTAGGGTTLTASVAATGGFTGAVALSASGVPANVGSASVAPATVDTAGTAQVTVQTLGGAPPGTYTVTVSGQSGGVVHTAAATLTVKAPPPPGDYSLSATPSVLSVRAGSAATVTVSLAALNGFTGSVTLSVTGVPPRTTASLAPGVVSVPGSSSLRLTTTWLTSRGTHTLTVTGRSGSLVHTVSIRLTVT
jgi:subtilisin family serine protease